MNHIIITNLTDLKSVINAPIAITGDKNEFDNETQKNMWFISFDEHMLSSITLQNLTTFIDDLIHTKKQQLFENYPNTPATFYLWFDEMAGQLRFNIASGHIKPPFECSVEFANSAQDILKECLTTQNHISWEELEMTEQDFNEDESSYTLKVYVLYL